MANQTDLSPELLGYLREVSLRDDPILYELREETAALPAGAAMQVSAEEGQLLALLVGLTGARTVLELGTFTGYSTLCMARALPSDGRLVTCDITDRWPAIGAGYWRRAAVADQIDVRVGPASATLAALRAENGPSSFDLAFIDADKTNYRAYYEGCLDLVRPGGLIVIDNTLFFGRVLDADARDPDTCAIRELNAFLLTDTRVDLSVLPVADGVTLARIRAGGH
ncbi:caffeoyl-CoA O-methyltransferase [Micromonospora sp. ATCC 39149]|uniref:Class I SAM-dependent methyltransferase n=1 Tax=Micromonospora carbonacea TaxID=47853 RepID=A0A7D5YD17_9ACTN|nr:class I SAM-dependent methyltransferase [Micromonospora sp. ATCC 39149]EEP70229.1 caffeoyl-CoA O-methyltransferase [Micromonospora sp. ATCC 39149]QLJ96656.1 class I SAM-dependent methyltransferase [Micromonospora carbonacea]